MKITITKIVLLALTLILIPSAIAAQTPDGTPPAEETVCDEYSGKTYGICNAYYQAMDCNNPDTRASKQACDNLKAKMDTLTTPSGETGTLCPCFGDLTQEGFTQNSTCSNGENVALIFDFSSTNFLMAQAGATSSFMGCDFNGVTQEPIPSNEAITCVNMITAFCDALLP